MRSLLVPTLAAAVLAAGCNTEQPSFAKMNMNMNVFSSDKPLRTLPITQSNEAPPALRIQQPTAPTGKLPVDRDPGMMRQVKVGASVEGRAITLYIFGTGPRPTFIFGGIHGDEGVGRDIGHRMIEHLQANPSVWSGRSIAILPDANPDGLSRGTRQNAHGVDCNRNFPASNWSRGSRSDRYYGGPSAASEPETRAIMQAIQMLAPGRIVSLHSISPGKHCNNYDGPGEGLAGRMAAANSYPIKATIGYPTPGSFGTWAGVDRHIPTITLELPAGRDAGSLWPRNKAALLAAIRDQQPALGN